MKLKKPDEVIRSATRRVGVLPDDYYNTIPVQVRNIAFTVSGIESMSEINTILNSLNKAVDEGQTFAQWRDTVDVGSFSGITQARQKLVYRMHMNTAYNQGKLDYARENKSLIPYLRYNAILDGVVRDDHAALDGLTRPVDDPIWDQYTPPIDFNCRCILVSLSKEQASDGGTRINENEGAATGKGLTPKKIAENIVKKNRPGKGFRFNKRKPIAALTNYYRRKVKSLPVALRKPYLERLLQRSILTKTWFDTNQRLFER